MNPKSDLLNKSEHSCKSNSSHRLYHDSSKEKVLAYDTLPYGICTVTLNIIKNGEDKSITYALHTLFAAEKNYAQIYEEGLAVVYGTKKFRQMLYNQSFTIMTKYELIRTI